MFHERVFSYLRRLLSGRMQIARLRQYRSA